MKTHRKTMRNSIWILLSITLIGCFASTSREALHRFQALEGPFSVTVYPVNVITHDGTVHDAALAQRLIKFLREEKIAEGVLAEKDADIEFEKSGIQGKMAKNSSKAFMEFIKHQELETDYALLVDILKGWGVGGVHIYLVDKDGNMAQFGLTNSHWEEFKIVKPVTKEDGCTVAVMMMKRMWSKHPADPLLLGASAGNKSQEKPESNINYSSEMEFNIDRPGQDYHNFNLSSANPELCKSACDQDSRCMAWTYVKPNTKQGPNPRCWLKHSVPKAKKNKCCISGHKN